MAVATSGSVGLVGWKALVRDITKLADDQSGPLLNALKQAGREAAEPVANRTRDRLPHVSGDLAGDVRVTSARTGASVRMGRSTIPYAPVIEFGWPEHNIEYVATGKYLFPSARGDLAGQVAKSYSEAINRALQQSGVWTNDTDRPEAVRD